MTANSIRSRVSPRRLAVLAAVAALSLAVFIVGSLGSLNHNDFMYAVAPAVWAQNGALYTDVPFPQAPLSILLNRALAAATGNVNIFLPARIVSMLLVFIAVLLPVLGRAKMKTVEIWTLYVALCLTNFFIINNSREIGNYALSLLCLSAAVTALNATGSAAWRGFAACVFGGLATSAKLYFVFLCPALFLCLLLNDRTARNPKVFAACGFGFLLGFAPLLYFLARDYQGFLQWNVRFFQMILPLRLTGPADALGRIANILVLFVTLMAIPIGFFAAALWRAWRGGGAGLRERSGQLLLLAAACAMAVSPIFVFGQYLGPLAFLLLLFSAPWGATKDRTRFFYLIFGGAMLVMQCVVMTAIVGPDLLRDRTLLLTQVLNVQHKARQMAVDGYSCERKFFSAAPLFLLENEIKYPPEFGAGPFLMFFLRGEELAKIGEAYDLDAHIKAWNPDIVIWGYHIGSREPAEDAVDRTIRDYAVSHAFVVTPLGQVDGHDIELGYRAGCRRAARP
jgi:hypothetical protein